MKRLMSVLMALAAVATCNAQKHAAEFEKDGIYYYIDNGFNPPVAIVTSAQGDVVNYFGIDKYKAELVVRDAQSSYSGVVEIPATVDYNGTTYRVWGIGYNAFANCSELKEVKWTDKMAIREYAFCNSKNVKLDFSKVSILGGLAFYENEIPHDVEFSGLVDIGNWGFTGYKGTEVTLPGCFVNLHSYAFEYTDIVNVNFEDNPEGKTCLLTFSFTNSKIKELRLPKRELYLAYDCFYQMPELETLIIPDVDCIYQLYEFQDFSISEGQVCKNFAWISECDKLKDIVMLGSVPPEITPYLPPNWYNFEVTTDYDTPTLRVPKGSEELYKAHRWWGRFARIEGFEPGEYGGIDRPDEVEADAADIAPVYYNLQGMRIDNPVKGNLYIRVTPHSTGKVVY